MPVAHCGTMMSFKGWGFATALALVQLCAGGVAVSADTLRTDAPARPAWCPTGNAASQTPASARLSTLAAKVRRGEPLTIVAIGSSSTEGSDLPDRLMAYPSHLQRQLNARLGSGRVKMVNKGRGGETMVETVARFGTDVAGEKPDLVIWQLGVNDVVRGNDMNLSERTIEDGMARLKGIGAPIVLMDMQLAPRVTASAQLPVMQRLLKDAAIKHNALLWSRFELMSGIVKSGDAQLVDLIKPDELHMTVAMHVCTGAVLGDELAAAMTARPALDMAAAKTP